MEIVIVIATELEIEIETKVKPSNFMFVADEIRIKHKHTNKMFVTTLIFRLNIKVIVTVNTICKCAINMWRLQDKYILDTRTT